MENKKRCVLYDRPCIECGECNLCDLDPNKICDNCGRCIGLGDGENAPAFRAIRIDGIIDETMDPAEYLYEESMLMDDAADNVPTDDDALNDDMFPFLGDRGK